MVPEIWANIGSGNVFFAWRHQAIALTNVEWWSGISKKILKGIYRWNEFEIS